MNSYSQNAEDIYVSDYFKGFKGTLLEIGANDGKTLSNSLLLIQNGWVAHLVEPGTVYNELFQRHIDNFNVYCHNFGIGESEMVSTFYESGCHVKNGDDIGLVSTIDFEETKRWPDVEFTKTAIQLFSYQDFWVNHTNQAHFDFISIDAEGLDWQILQQIDLTLTSCLCIEWNGIEAFKVQFENYCGLYGLKLAHVNSENLIFIK